MIPSDVLGLGKVMPIDKLIDILSNSFGKLSKSYFYKKDVDAKAYEIEKLAEARAKEMTIIAAAVKENYLATGGIEYKDGELMINSPKDRSTEAVEMASTNTSLEVRTQERVVFQEAKKQLNIENVVAFATEELKNEGFVTNDPLDEDWITRFFRISEDVSSEEMQALWGKILAGEIKQPKSYSLRTLDLIRNLTKSDAAIFMKVANYAITSNGSNYVFKTNKEDALYDGFDLKFGDFLLLIEIGIIQPGDFIIHQIAQKSTDSQHVFVSGNIAVIVDIIADTPTIQMPVHKFTTSGNELLKLVKVDAPINYLSMIAKSIKSDRVAVKYGQIVEWEKDGFSVQQPLLEFQ